MSGVIGFRGAAAALAIAAGVLSAGCGGVAQHTATVVSGVRGSTATSDTAGMPKAGPESSEAYRSLDAAHHPDWLGALPDGLGLGRLSVPGTHDTMAFHGDKAGPAVVTQQRVTAGCGFDDKTCVSRRSLRAQLDAGIRALDIRVRRDENDGLALQHGSFYQDAHLDDVLAVADQFLADHPRETVLMRVKAECDNTGKPFTCDDAGRVPPDPALIDRYLTADPHVWQPSVTGRAALPALGEVRGRIVLTQFDNIANGDQRGLPLDIQDDWHDPSVDAKWAAISAQLDKAATGDSHTLYLNFLSASGVPDPARVPERYAHDENPRTLDRLRAEPGRTAGLLMADFPGSALIDEIIGHNPR